MGSRDVETILRGKPTFLAIIRHPKCPSNHHQQPITRSSGAGKQYLPVGAQPTTVADFEFGFVIRIRNGHCGDLHVRPNVAATPEVEEQLLAMVPMGRLERLSPVFVTRPMNRLIHEMSASGHKRTHTPALNMVRYRGSADIATPSVCCLPENGRSSLPTLTTGTSQERTSAHRPDRGDQCAVIAQWPLISPPRRDIIVGKVRFARRRPLVDEAPGHDRDDAPLAVARGGHQGSVR